MKGVQKLSHLIGVITACFLLAGCVFDGHKFEDSVRYQPSDSLSGSKIYVYSLLDFRESSYGPNTLAQFEKQLTDRFADVGVTAKVTNFRRSSVGSYYSVTNSAALIPLKQIVEQARSDEIAFGAQYRLLILPTETEATATNFKITWTLLRASEGKTIWSGRSQMHTDYIWSTDGTALFGRDIAGHAKFLLDPFFAQLKAQGLVP